MADGGGAVGRAEPGPGAGRGRRSRRRGEDGGTGVRVLVAVALVWVVAAFAGVPVAADLAGRAQALREDAADSVRRWATGQEDPGPWRAGPPGSQNRPADPADPEEPPPPWRRLPGQQGGPSQPPPAGTPSGVVDALDSVVQILVARCSAGGAGSGFVIGDGRVMTNAHVVEGASRVRVLTRGGERLDARVVQFDQATDVAVLDVEDLDADPLQPASPADPGDDAWVAGHPLGGPLRVVDATVVGTRSYRGADQETYVLQTRVRPGNSGGPLLDEQGNVLGLVFATAADGDPVGYARTWSAVADEAEQGLGNDDTVSNGTC